MRPTMVDDRNDLLSDLVDHVKLVAKEHGLDDDTAEQLAINIANFICEHFAGQLISFPINYYFKLAARDMRIYDDWTAKMSWAQLVSKYGMTRDGIYKVIRRVEKRIVKRDQPDLFREES